MVRTMLKRAGRTVGLLVALSAASASSAAAACLKCEYILFNGWGCVNVGPNEDGKTGCDASQTCGTYGTPCSGSSGGGTCNPAPCGPKNPTP
jgi:hypothetical protein